MSLYIIVLSAFFCLVVLWVFAVCLIVCGFFSYIWFHRLQCVALSHRWQRVLYVIDTVKSLQARSVINKTDLTYKQLSVFLSLYHLNSCTVSAVFSNVSDSVGTCSWLNWFWLFLLHSLSSLCKTTNSILFLLNNLDKHLIYPFVKSFLRRRRLVFEFNIKPRTVSLALNESRKGWETASPAFPGSTLKSHLLTRYILWQRVTAFSFIWNLEFHKTTLSQDSDVKLAPWRVHFNFFRAQNSKFGTCQSWLGNCLHAKLDFVSH